VSQLLSFVLLALSLLTAAVARGADSGFELELSAGWGESRSSAVDSGPLETSFDLDGSQLFGLAGFYRLNTHWALGLEYAHNQADLDDFAPLPVQGDVVHDSLMANGEYRFGTERLRPFVGVGLGWGRLSSDARAATLKFTEDGDFFMAQIMAGLRYRVHDKVSLMGQVRYRHADDARLKVSDQLDFSLDDGQFLAIIGLNIAF
jgi:opacity protein-like surface antigen